MLLLQGHTPVLSHLDKHGRLLSICSASTPPPWHPPPPHPRSDLAFTQQPDLFFSVENQVRIRPSGAFSLHLEGCMWTLLYDVLPTLCWFFSLNITSWTTINSGQMAPSYNITAFCLFLNVIHCQLEVPWLGQIPSLFFCPPSYSLNCLHLDYPGSR